MLSMATIIGISANAFGAMFKIAMISFVGVIMAKWPKDVPTLSKEVLGSISVVSTTVFFPCFCAYSLGSSLNMEMLANLGITIPICLAINIFSYLCGKLFGRLFMKLDSCPNEGLFTAVVVAVGNPAPVAVPILVMQTLCSDKLVMQDYDTEDQCILEANSIMFIYGLGWSLTYWVHGFPTLQGIPHMRNIKNSDGSLSAMKDETSSSSALLSTLYGILTTPSMIAVYAGFVIGLIPTLQKAFFFSESAMAPLGGAIFTLGQPVIAVNYIIMGASLAHAFAAAQSALSSGAPSAQGGIASSSRNVQYAKVPQSSPEIEDSEVQMGYMTMANTAEGDASVDKMNTALEEDMTSNAAEDSGLPGWGSVLTMCLCRLVFPPLFAIPLTLLMVRMGMLSQTARLMQLVICIESASASPQLLIASLNQIGLSTIASQLSYLYIYQFASCIVTMTLWATVAIALIYD